MSAPVAIAEAASVLRAGGLVVMPTDTVYGLGAIPGMPAAIEALFTVKGRPRDKAIPVLGAARADLEQVAVFDDPALLLSDRFWPGPLTLVLRRAPGFVHDLGGDAGSSGTVAVRVPAHQAAIDLLHVTGPLAVTSANRSGEGEAHTLEEARRALGTSLRGGRAVYIDGGRVGGAPSTVVSVIDGVRVLRQGALPADEIDQTLTS